MPEQPVNFFPLELTEDELSLRIKEWMLLGYTVVARDVVNHALYAILDLPPSAVNVVLLLVAGAERHPALRYDKQPDGTWSKVYGATHYNP
jgi:hypothetical protein